MKNISVIGAGTMGNGIAHTFAQFGYKVVLIDVMEESLNKGMATIAKNLDRIVAKGIITEAEKANTLANIAVQTDLVKGVEQAELVVEAATENLDLKLTKKLHWIQIQYEYITLSNKKLKLFTTFKYGKIYRIKN